MPDAESLYALLSSASPLVRQLPEDVWIVGGGLRDAALERMPRDVDCAAPRAEEASADFAERTGGRRVCLAREPLETWRVVIKGLEYDFTDMEGGSIESDLDRRDFTIGAFAVSASQPYELCDPHGGLRDIELQLVRMVSAGNLLEDPIRILRAVRLAVQLGFEIESETMEVVMANADVLRRSAAERVTAELDEILASITVERGLNLMVASTLDKVVLEGGFDDEAIARCSRVVSPDITTRYAALFVGREETVPRHAESARWSQERRKTVSRLLEFLSTVRNQGGDALMPLLVHDYGTRIARRVAELLTAVGEGRLALQLARIVRERGSALEGLRPILDGRMIGKIAGLDAGPEIGRIQRLLIEAQIRGEIRTPAEAEEFVRQVALP